MIDYFGFAQGFALLFIAAPLATGLAAGALWAWHSGRRGGRLVLFATACGSTLTALVFVAAVLLFRA